MAMSKEERRIAAFERAERIKREVQYRKAGMTVEQIAEILDVNKSTVSRDLRKAISELYTEDAQALVDLEVGRIEDLIKANYGAAVKGHLGAGKLVLALSESKRKLLGLDAPAKVDLGVPDIDMDSAAQEIMRAAHLAQEAGSSD